LESTPVRPSYFERFAEVGDINIGLAEQADFVGREILKFKVPLPA